MDLFKDEALDTLIVVMIISSLLAIRVSAGKKSLQSPLSQLQLLIEFVLTGNQQPAVTEKMGVRHGSCPARNEALNRLREVREELAQHVQVTRRDVVQQLQRSGRRLQGLET